MSLAAVVTRAQHAQGAPPASFASRQPKPSRHSPLPEVATSLFCSATESPRASVCLWGLPTRRLGVESRGVSLSPASPVEKAAKAAPAAATAAAAWRAAAAVRGVVALGSAATAAAAPAAGELRRRRRKAAADGGDDGSLAATTAATAGGGDGGGGTVAKPCPAAARAAVTAVAARAAGGLGNSSRPFRRRPGRSGYQVSPRGVHSGGSTRHPRMRCRCMCCRSRYRHRSFQCAWYLSRRSDCHRFRNLGRVSVCSC